MPLPIAKKLDDYFDLIPLRTDSPVMLGPFAIECRPTIHAVPTTAFRITVGGRTLAFSADTAFDPTLIDWLARADLIVHEASDDDELNNAHPLHPARPSPRSSASGWH